MRVQHKSCEALLLMSTYNQKQAHAEYEIVSITSSQIACIANIYSQNNVSKLRRMKGRHEEDH